MLKKRWVVQNSNGGDLESVLLKNRNVRDPESFFKPHLYKFTSPGKTFPDLDKTITRIKKAINNGELIYIYGDFDVDGITATAILWETIDFLGGKVLPYIPHRVTEGYGLHTEAIKNLAKEAKVIISVDCGITAVEEAEIAKKLGVDLIITDHHLLQKETPQPFALLHTEKLSGSGIAFALAKSLLAEFSKEASDQLYKNLELSAIGTIADMVPLTEDNRILSANGLSALSKTSRIGLKALYNEADVTGKIGTYEVGFIISPRLNSAGRMEHALDSLRLLLTRDKTRAQKLSRALAETNRKRQEAMRSAWSHARENLNGASGKMIIAHHPSYAEGIVGLVAGKLMGEYYRPTIVISEMDPISKGSARSIQGFNITDAIISAKAYLRSHGGHPMAAGFSIEQEKIPDFKEQLLKYAENNLKKDYLTPELKIDFDLPAGKINNETLDLLKTFEPFGIGNPEAAFLTKDLEVLEKRKLGKEGKHLRMILRSPDNFSFHSIGFGMGDENVDTGDKIEIVYNLHEDNWNKNNRLELKIKDFRVLS